MYIYILRISYVHTQYTYRYTCIYKHTYIYISCIHKNNYTYIYISYHGIYIYILSIYTNIHIMYRYTCIHVRRVRSEPGPFPNAAHSREVHHECY